MTLRRLPVLAVLVALATLVVVAPAQVTAQEAGPTVTQHVVTSFDDTPIVTSLFVPAGASAEAPVPLVLQTHGWAGTGAVTPDARITRLLEEGYAVLTWDQRGFGCSGGEVQIDDPDTEGRDVSALIDWAVANAPIRLVDGDPVVGMVGGSYAGGIQTATAAIDPRLDALAPEISWGDLRYSLYPGEVVKQGWAAILYSTGLATAEFQGLSPDCPAGPQEGGLAPAITEALTEATTTGAVSATSLEFFAKSSLVHYGQQRPVAVPTLVANGSVDTLFNLTDGLKVHEHVLAQGAESRYVLFCGGHVSCPTTYADADDAAHLRDAVITWFARHLKGEDVDTGPRVEYRTNVGEWRGLDAFPGADSSPLTVAGEAERLVVVPVLDIPNPAALAELQADGGSLPPNPLTASRASQPGDPRAATFEVTQAAEGPLEIVGVPTVELTVTGELLDTLDQLPAEDLQAALDQLALDGLQPVTDATGEAVGTAPVAGGVVQGLTGGLSDVTVGDTAPDSVNLFVKLVHRETGEVLNLQEGAIRVPVIDRATNVDVPMPGLAYTLPEGHHLDLEVSTASLMHSTGRLPAVVDVAVAASIPTVPAAATEEPRTAPAAPPSGTLPATGGTTPLVAMVLLAVGLLLHRRR